MKIKHMQIVVIIYIVLSMQLFAQNHAPVVDSVTFNQRTDGTLIVDIYYDVSDNDGNTMTVSMQVSDDDGSTWDFSCNNISGDIGVGIINGTGKHIVWDFGAEHPQTFGDQFRIKILADDGVSEDGGEPCPGIPTVAYAGKVYNTVQIGTQCWLKENLDVGTMIQGTENMTDNSIIEKYCYNNDPNNCNTYGGLYQWDEAMQYITTEGAQGICPNGWHIPTIAELHTLSDAVGGDGNSLKVVGEGTGDGTGTNDNGFSALLTGYRINSQTFNYLDNYTYYWSSIEYSSSYIYRLRLRDINSEIDLTYASRSYGFCVRCLND